MPARHYRHSSWKTAHCESMMGVHEAGSGEAGPDTVSLDSGLDGSTGPRGVADCPRPAQQQTPPLTSALLATGGSLWFRCRRA